MTHREGRDESRIGDQVGSVLTKARRSLDDVGVHGLVIARLFGERMQLKQRAIIVPNLITDVGDEYFAERAAGIAAPPDQVSGMRLGTNNAAATKTGAGAAIGTYVSGSSLAIDGGFPTSSQPGGPATARRITWEVTYAPGVATASGIEEAVITNEAVLSDVAGVAANTICRAILSPVVNKGAGDTLVVTWQHDLLGA